MSLPWYIRNKDTVDKSLKRVADPSAWEDYFGDASILAREVTRLRRYEDTMSRCYMRVQKRALRAERKLRTPEKK